MNLCPRIIIKYNFRKADYELINNELDKIDWGFLSESPINSAIQKFYDTLNEIIHKFTPQHRDRVDHKFPIWFDHDLKSLLRKKERARCRYKRTNQMTDYLKFSDLRRECKVQIDNSHSKYIDHIQSNVKTNIKLFWAYTKSKRQTNSYPSKFKLENVSTSSPKEVCELFATFFRSIYKPKVPNRTFNIDTTQTANPNTANPLNITPYDVENTISKLDLNKNGGPDGIPNFFLKHTMKQLSAPLALIFKRSVRTSQFPTAFKTSKSTAIFKKGDESDITNYRQVCMSNSIAIVFEKIMHSHILSIVGSQISRFQHGFRKNKSTNSNLIEYISRLSAALDAGLEIHVIYTDFCKAFDTVDHDILLKKLSRMGIDVSLLK